jgi:hypothetical protein
MEIDNINVETGFNQPIPLISHTRKRPVSTVDLTVDDEPDSTMPKPGSIVAARRAKRLAREAAEAKAAAAAAAVAAPAASESISLSTVDPGRDPRRHQGESLTAVAASGISPRGTPRGDIFDEKPLTE